MENLVVVVSGYDFKNWYENHYHELCSGGVWLRGGEINTIASDEYLKRNFRALFVRLSSYFDTRESFTHQLLYQLAVSIPGVYADLSYLPLKQDAEVFKRDGIPWLLGTQSKFGPEKFDFIGFSNSVVLELINLPSFLKNSSIPLSKRERLQRENLPLIVLGGANAIHSSVFWGEDPIIDGVFIGQSEKAIADLLKICRDGKASGLSKEEILSHLETVDGFFQPERHGVVKAAIARNLGEEEPLVSGPVIHTEDSAGNASLQISEGCPCFCTFCAESWQRKPYRERSLEEVLDIAKRVKAGMGLSQINLYSFNFNQHSDIYRLLWELAVLFGKVGLKSQRFDILAHDPHLLDILHVLDKTTITCGLEGISPRLRRFLHKNLEDKDLISAIGGVFRSRARELKVSLIAVGLEEEEDFIEFKNLLKNIAAKREAEHSNTRVIFSNTPLVRFPWTPLEFMNACQPERYELVIKRTKQIVSSSGFEFREAAELDDYLVSQLLVRASGVATRKALLDAIEYSGFVYYKEMQSEFTSVLESRLKARGVVIDDALKGITLDDSGQPPWALVQTGIKREHLKNAFKAAMEFRESEYCLGRSWAVAKCRLCGACHGPDEIRKLTYAKQKREYNASQLKDRIKAWKQNSSAISIVVDFSEQIRGLPRSIGGAAVARALMLADKRLVPGYMAYQGSFWAKDDDSPWILGSDIIELRWSNDSIGILGELLQNNVFLKKVNENFRSYGSIIEQASEKWRPSKIEFDSDLECKPDNYLKERGLKYTLLKNTGEGFLYQLNRESIKKGIISALGVKKGELELLKVELAFGPKFKLKDFVQESFRCRDKSEWVRVKARSLLNS